MPVERNLIPNPACALDATGWAATPATYARSTTVNPLLSRATGYEGTDVADINSPRAAVSAGQQYVFSFDICALGAQDFGALVNFYDQNIGGNFIANSGPSVAVQVAAGGVARIVMGPYTAPAGAQGAHIKWNDIDAGGCELTAVRCAPSTGNVTIDGQYFDGASPGAVWDGTANASTSTRRIFRDTATGTDGFSIVSTAAGPVATDSAQAQDGFSIVAYGTFADSAVARDGFLIAALSYDDARGRVRLEAFTFAEQVTQARVRRRRPGGRLVEVRGGRVDVVGGLMSRLVDDYEYPAGLDVEYLIEGVDDTGRVWQSATVPRAAGDDRPWLKFIANPTLNRRVTILDWGEIGRPSGSDTFKVQGKREPIVVSDVHGSRQVEVQLVVEDNDAADALDDALSRGHAIFFQVPRDLQLPTLYAAVGNYSWRKPARRSGRSIFALPLTEVEAPPPSIVPRQTTYADSLALYPTYRERVELGRTYREAAS